MICGAALGSGFGLVESALRHKVSFNQAVTPHFLSWSIFNDSYGGFIGHGGSTALIALALGVLVYARTRRRLLLPAGILLVAVTAWMMVDHALANYQTLQSASSWFAPLRWIWMLDGQGSLTPFFALMLIIVAILTERLLIHPALRRIPHATLRDCLRSLVQPLRSGYGYGQLRECIMRLRKLFLYVLARRQIGYLALHARDARVTPRLACSIANRTAEVIVFQLAARQP
jgi:hypothetical protein